MDYLPHRGHSYINHQPFCASRMRNEKCKMQNYQRLSIRSFSSRYFHREGGSFVGLAFGPHTSAHAFHGLSRHSETDTGVGISPSMRESMKYLEYPVMILHIKTDPVTFHPYDKLFFSRITTNGNPWSRKSRVNKKAFSYRRCDDSMKNRFQINDSACLLYL
jgi:hypothetical protein